MSRKNGLLLGISLVFLMNITLRKLRVAAAVARNGSIARAAFDLALTPSGVAAALDGLEADIGVRIFDRRPAKGVTLTPAGRDIVSNAEAILQDMDSFQEHAINWIHSLSGDLHVGCFATFSPLFIPPVLEEYTRRHPNVTIHLHESSGEEIETMIQNGSVDIALTYDLCLRQNLPREVLAPAPTHVVLAAEAPEAKQNVLRLAQLCDLPMILFDYPLSKNYFLSLFQAAKLAPKILYRTQNYQTVCELVGAGLGYSLLNLRPPAELSYHGYRLVRRPLADQYAFPSIVLSYPDGKKRSPIVEVFGTLCNQHVRKVATEFTVGSG